MVFNLFIGRPTPARLAADIGNSVTGTWAKAGVNETFELRTDSGEALELAPGNTWVELPAPSAGVEAR